MREARSISLSNFRQLARTADCERDSGDFATVSTAIAIAAAASLVAPTAVRRALGVSFIFFPHDIISILSLCGAIEHVSDLWAGIYRGHFLATDRGRCAF
jgi:hypothetical protein